MYDLNTIDEELNENCSTIYYNGRTKMSIKTKNKFLIKLLEEFLLSLNGPVDIQTGLIKIFFKIFADSLEDVNPNCILDFSQQLF